MPQLTPVEHRGGLKFVWQCCACGTIFQEEQVSGEHCPVCDDPHG
jgi:rubrerythrin